MPAEDELHLDEVLHRISDTFHFRNRRWTALQHQPPGNEKEAWQKCDALSGKYDKEMCEAYREQIDTLLVFAGLFSAVVTAFSVESYQWLNHDSGDASVELLAQLVDMLAHNQSGKAVASSATTAISTAAATRINVYWFLSLTLGLSAALVGILAKQWIREYDRDVGRLHSQSIAVRQMKFEGLEAWRVTDIVSSVSLFLQVALVLFLLGILELLWRLSPVVAIPVTILSCVTIIFYAATTVLPGLRLAFWLFNPGTSPTQCPFKSPQAWLFLRLVSVAISYLAVRIASRKAISERPPFRSSEYAPFEERMSDIPQLIRDVTTRPRSWVEFDLAWTRLSDSEPAHPLYKFRGLSWLRRTLDHPDLPIMSFHCLWPAANGNRERNHLDIAVNLGCLEATRDAHVPTRRGTPHWMQVRLDCHSVLLRHASALSLPYNTRMEILCRIYESQLHPTTQFLEFIKSALIANVPPQDETLDINICERLFHAVSRIMSGLPIQRRTDPGCQVISVTYRLIDATESSSRKEDLYLALCTILHRVLQYDKTLGLTNEDPTYFCYRYLKMIVTQLPTPLPGRCVSILGLLAASIDDAWRSLRGQEAHVEKDLKFTQPIDLDGHLTRVFCALVDAVTPGKGPTSYFSGCGNPGPSDCRHLSPGDEASFNFASTIPRLNIDATAETAPGNADSPDPVMGAECIAVCHENAGSDLAVPAPASSTVPGDTGRRAFSGSDASLATPISVDTVSFPVERPPPSIQVGGSPAMPVSHRSAAPPAAVTDTAGQTYA